MSSELTVVRLELYDGRSGPRLASDVGVSSAGLCVCGGVALRLSDESRIYFLSVSNLYLLRPPNLASCICAFR